MSSFAFPTDDPEFPEGPPTWPPWDPEVAQALQQLAVDGSWGRYDGPHVERLTEALAQLHSVPHVWLCSSGTFAVELALRALPLQPGDEVLLAGYDFAGNFRAIEAAGGLPVLVDLEPEGWQMQVDGLEAACSPRTRAVLVSHLHGGLADMQRLCEFATARGLFVVEDACQTPGAWVQGRRAGTWGDVGVLSFGGSKLLSAGRGGALLTRQPALFQRAKSYCERGNNAYPLSEMQAAVLLPQVQQLDARNAVRHANVGRLAEQCQNLPGLRWVLHDRSNSLPSYYKVGLSYEGPPAWPDRDTFLAAMRAQGVALDTGFRGFLRRGGRRCRQAHELTHSQRAVETTVLLHHPILLSATSDIDRVARALCKVLNYFLAGSRR